MMSIEHMSVDKISVDEMSVDKMSYSQIINGAVGYGNGGIMVFLGDGPTSF